MTQRVSGFAPAKVNLCLHITGRRADGYHLLESLVVFADVADRVSVEIDPSSRLVPGPEPAHDSQLFPKRHPQRGPAQYTEHVDGPFAAALTAALSAHDPQLSAPSPITHPSSMARAVQAWGRARIGSHEAWPAMRVALTKHLPLEAGLGGGSADAAAVLRLLDDTLTPRPQRYHLAQLSLALGADTPVCVMGVPAIMAGIGEAVTPLDRWPALWCVLVNPAIAAPTAAVFAAYHAAAAPFDAPGLAPPQTGDGTAAVAWLAHQRNALEPVAAALFSPIGEAMAALDQAGARLVRMTGSGATVFGLFETDAAAQAAATRVARAQPTWWVRATRLAGQP